MWCGSSLGEWRRECEAELLYYEAELLYCEAELPECEGASLL